MLVGWRRLALLTSIALSIAPGALADLPEGPRPAFPNETECPTPLADHAPGPWSQQEEWAWNERICLGRSADLSRRRGGAGGDCEPANGEDWPEDRVLTSSFLQTVLFHEPFRSAYTQRGVHLRCARFDETLDLSGGHFAHDLFVAHSYFSNDIYAHDLQIDHNLSLAGSHVTGSVIAYRMRVGHDLILRGQAQFQTVELLGATIGGSLSATGSAFKDVFDADQLTVNGSVFFRDGAEFQGVILRRASIGGNLEAISSTFKGVFNASGLTVNGSVFFGDGAEFQEVNLVGASINGSLDADRSTFNDVFDASALTVNGSVFLRDRAEFQGVILRRASIGGSLEADRSTFNDVFDADRLTVNGSVFFRDRAAFQEVNLIGASINGSLEANSSVFNDVFHADGLAVNDSVLFRYGAEFQDVRLLVATIGETLQIRGSRFSGSFDASGTQVGRDLVLSDRVRAPEWLDGAELSLRNVSVGALQDTPEAWDGLQGRVDLVGFTYEDFGGLHAIPGGTMASRDVRWMIEWIGLQENFGDGYFPQPFQQLADTLRAQGYPDKANRILIAANNHRRDASPTHWTTEALLWVGWATIGYGYRTWLAMIELAALVLIGAAIARSDRGLYWGRTWRNRLFGPFWYSLDQAIPFLQLDESHKFRRATGWRGGYFHVQHIVGFLLVSLFVAGLTGLVGQ